MILLLGGSSSVGKTTAVATLAQNAEATVHHLDDFAADSSDLRIRFFSDPSIFSRYSPQQLVERLRAKSKALSPILTSLVLEAMDISARVIVEGEGIEPQWCAELDPQIVRYIAVVETCRRSLHETLLQRSSRFVQLDPRAQEVVVEMNAQYGEWLQEETHKHGGSVVTSRPRHSLVDRIRNAQLANP